MKTLFLGLILSMSLSHAASTGASWYGTQIEVQNNVALDPIVVSEFNRLLDQFVSANRLEVSRVKRYGPFLIEFESKSGNCLVHPKFSIQNPELGSEVTYIDSIPDFVVDGSCTSRAGVRSLKAVQNF